ncbi:Hpt domain-containing protein [Pseudoalteromonas sp.]|uniref:Hpt domain-containing protein n=1 Tax=Pseudoalteromonas sp. TaxID=53249 RepID=UPI0035618B1E
MLLDKALFNSDISDQRVLVQLAQDVGMETLETLIQLFIGELATLSARLSDAITHSNTKEIQQVVHVLKNSAALFGAMPLAILAEQLHGTQSLSEAQQFAAAQTIQQKIAASRNAYQQLVTRTS